MSACNRSNQSLAVSERLRATLSVALDCCTPRRRVFQKGATVKQIISSNGKTILVDDTDYPILSQFKWRAQQDHKTFYAVRMGKINGKPACVRMHRQILDFPASFVDHANRNGLDNRRQNLRLATNAQNQANAEKHRDSENPSKGVWWNKKRSRWLVRLTVAGKRTHIGYFRELPDAVSAYSKASVDAYGQFAKV